MQIDAGSRQLDLEYYLPSLDARDMFDVLLMEYWCRMMSKRSRCVFLYRSDVACGLEETWTAT